MIQALIREYKLDGWMVQKNTYTGDFYIGGPMVPDQIKIVNGKAITGRSCHRAKDGVNGVHTYRVDDGYTHWYNVGGNIHENPELLEGK